MPTVEAGSPVRWHRPETTRRDRQALKGTKPQERRPIDHGFLVKRRRWRRAPLETVHAIGPAVPARPAVPERAVAGRCGEAHAGV